MRPRAQAIVDGYEDRLWQKLLNVSFDIFSNALFVELSIGLL